MHRHTHASRARDDGEQYIFHPLYPSVSQILFGPDHLPCAYRYDLRIIAKKEVRAGVSLPRESRGIKHTGNCLGKKTLTHTIDEKTRPCILASVVAFLTIYVFLSRTSLEDVFSPCLDSPC